MTMSRRVRAAETQNKAFDAAVKCLEEHKSLDANNLAAVARMILTMIADKKDTSQLRSLAAYATAGAKWVEAFE